MEFPEDRKGKIPNELMQKAVIGKNNVTRLLPSESLIQSAITYALSCCVLMTP